MDNECTELLLNKLKLWYNTKKENLLCCALLHVSLCSKARKASKLHWLETRSPVLLHKNTSRTTSARCPIKFLWHLDHTRDTEWGPWIQKQGKKCSGQVFKCSPTCDSVLTDNHQRATSTGLWRPEIGLDYLSISLLESNLYVILLRTGDDIHRVSGRKNYSGERGKFTLQLSMWMTVGKKNSAHRSSVTLPLLPEMPYQCQRAKKFLHMRHNFRSLSLCKCYTPCLECPSLPLSGWRHLNYHLIPSSGATSSRKPSLTPSARVRFLNIGTIDIWGRIIPCCER